MAETATATAAPEMGAAQSNAPQGSDANRSLTSPPAPGGQPNNNQPAQQQLSPLEQAIAAENALADQQRAMVNGEIPPTTVQDPVEPANNQEPPQETAQDGEPLDADDPQAMVRDDKGRFIMRPARAKKLMEKAHAYDELIAQLEQQHKQAIIQTAQQGQQPTQKPKAEPQEQTQAVPVEIDAKINDARNKLKEARANFDTDAEIVAQEQLIDLLAQRKTEAALQQFNQQHKQATEETQWHAKLEAVEQQHNDTMQKMWQEDQARIEQIRQQTKNDDLDLQDRESPFFQEVLGQLNQWARSKDPIMLRPNKLRRAVEIVADRHGIDLPPVQQIVQQAQQSAPAAKPNVTVHRKNAAAIAAGSPSGAAPQTSANIIQNLNQLPPSQRLGMLAQIMDEQAKRGITPTPIRFM